MNTQLTVKTGECEVCDKVDVKIRLQKNGNIWMCESCFESDVQTQTQNAKVLIQTSRKIDSELVLKADLFEAGTIAFNQMHGAINADSTIPESQKDYALMTEIAARIDKLSAVIFEEESALTAKRNERHALLVNAQTVAARLHAEAREKFKQYNVNYQPKPVRTIKPKAVPKKKFDKAEVFAAAAKYKVPAAQVQSIVASRNVSPDEAGQIMAKMLGLL
jgi:hypothetical protein